MSGTNLRRSGVGALAIAAVAIVAACGGGDDNGDDGADSDVTVEAYLEQADAICARYDARFDAVEQPTSDDTLRPFLIETLEIGEAQTAELDALEVPAELADLEAEARANNEEAASLLEEAIDRLDDGEDVATVVDDVAGQGERIDSEGQRIAEEMGLEVCSADEEDEVATVEDPPSDSLESGDPTTDEAPAPDDTTGSAAGQYLIDVSTASGSLNEIGEIFTDAADPEALQARAGEVQANVDEFNSAIDSMSTYTLDDPDLEQQRAGFVAAGRELASPLGDLSNAVAAGDLEALGAALPALTAAAMQFQDVTGQIP